MRLAEQVTVARQSANKLVHILCVYTQLCSTGYKAHNQFVGTFSCYQIHDNS